MLSDHDWELIRRAAYGIINREVDEVRGLAIHTYRTPDDDVVIRLRAKHFNLEPEDHD